MGWVIGWAGMGFASMSACRASSRSLTSRAMTRHAASCWYRAVYLAGELLVWGVSQLLGVQGGGGCPDAGRGLASPPERLCRVCAPTPFTPEETHALHTRGNPCPSHPRKPMPFTPEETHALHTRGNPCPSHRPWAGDLRPSGPRAKVPRSPPPAVWSRAVS
eukprot:scaffold14305_cov76-Isochrysis_galbana.AAC.1